MSAIALDSSFLVDVDTGTISYYDTTTGALVAITAYRMSNEPPPCLAGPSSISIPKQCPNPNATEPGRTCPDAGTSG